MKLAQRIRRWWSPAQWRDDHPLDGGSGSPAASADHPLDPGERLEERLRDRNWWEQAQDAGKTLLPREDDR